MNPKDRSLVARMAGNIAGGIWANLELERRLGVGVDGKIAETIARHSVATAFAILDEIDARVYHEQPCAGCGLSFDQHPNDSGCQQWHRKP